MGEFSNLQIDDDQTTKTAVKEQQVDAVPLIADPQPPLPGKEGELAAEFQEEMFQPVDQGFFQSAFGILILQSQELENEWVFVLLFRSQLLGRFRHATSAENCGLVVGQLGALEELGGNLTVELAHRPA